jgi:hypothetical protein
MTTEKHPISEADAGAKADGADNLTDTVAKLAQPEPQVFDIRIAADGNWFHEGGLIGRLPLVKLFASVLRRESDGSYWLVTPVERGRIVVEDAPFIVTKMNVAGTGASQIIRFVTNVDDVVTLSAEHPLVMRGHANGDDVRPYVEIRRGLDACLSRPVFYELANLAVDAPENSPDYANPDDINQAILGVWSSGVFFPLVGPTTSPPALGD